MPKPIHLIAAIDQNRGLGKDNDLAWSLPEDMKHFKKITTTTENPAKTNAVLMGRKTWDSIPSKYRPLPNRLNVVLSRSLDQPPQNAQLFHDLDEAIKSLQSDEQIETIFIIGGSTIYNQSLKDLNIEKIYITQLNSDHNCDTFLDPLPSQFKLKGESDSKSYKDIEYKFQVFSKN